MRCGLCVRQPAFVLSRECVSFARTRKTSPRSPTPIYISDVVGVLRAIEALIAAELYAISSVRQCAAMRCEAIHNNEDFEFVFSASRHVAILHATGADVYDIALGRQEVKKRSRCGKCCDQEAVCGYAMRSSSQIFVKTLISSFSASRHVAILHATGADVYDIALGRQEVKMRSRCGL